MNSAEVIPDPCTAKEEREYGYSWNSAPDTGTPEEKTYQVVFGNYNANGGMQVEEVTAVKFEFDSMCHFIRFFDDKGEVVGMLSNNGIKIIKIKHD